jgi:hypothetical protein
MIGMKLHIVVATALLLSTSFAHAQADKKAAAKGKDSKEAVEEDFPVMPEEPAVVKEFTRGEIQAICKKYEGHLIAYYGDVYKVEKCLRRPIINNKTVYGMQRSGQKVLDVSGDVVAALEEGDALDFAETKAQARTCKQLEGKYVTFSNVDVYFVERCTRRMFPDWETYIRHREKRGDKKGEILSLSWIEFDQLKSGDDIPSVVDDMFKRLLTGEAGVEVIPIDEACQGVDGKVVSYYQRLYKIERCRKREILDPELYLKRLGLGKSVKITELNSEQWLSLPDGKPIEDQTKKAAEAEAKKKAKS